jgi:hypothetical protein
MEFFYAMTKVTMGNGAKARFWDAPWADGLAPKTIMPSIYSISKSKGRFIQKAITDDAWILQIDISNGLSVQHFQEFTKLWEIVSNTHLDDDTLDPSIGSLHHPTNTLVLWPIMRNSLAQSSHPWAPWFGRIGLHQSAIFCLANHSKPGVDIGSPSKEGLAKCYNLPSL